MLCSPYPLDPPHPVPTEVVGTLKLSIQYALPPLLPLAPSPLASTEVVGTYEGLLQLSECTCGGSICRWWGQLTTICGNRTFSVPGGGDPKT